MSGWGKPELLGTKPRERCISNERREREEKLQAHHEHLSAVNRMLQFPEDKLMEIFNLVAQGLPIDRAKYGLTPDELDGIVADAEAALKGEVHVDVIAKHSARD